MIRLATSQIGLDGYRVDGEESGELLDLANDPVARAAGNVTACVEK